MGSPSRCRRRVQTAIHVAQGLAALHSRDVVHRDLKPSNILFDEHGNAKVADLGLAQIPGGPSLRSQRSSSPPHPGTPEYMSPEQASGRDFLSSASDIFALGLVLFETLTGRLYKSERTGTRASQLRRDVPDWLDKLVAAHCLSRDPEKRPWDGAEAAKLLRKGASGCSLALPRALLDRVRSGPQALARDKRKAWPVSRP